MKKIFFLLFPALLLIAACTQAQKSETKLDAAAFSEKLAATPTALVLDVRTPDEFSSGHLVNAKNIDWNSDEFDVQTSKIDKAQPLFVYCQSGRRSAAAASQLRKEGFREVYDLRGGFSNWRKAGLPVAQP